MVFSKCIASELAGADIRDLIAVDEVMEAVHLGPNGALMYCMEYLAENFDWFEEQLSLFGEDDYLVLDCPGQIELYSHVNVMKRVAAGLLQQGFNVCGVFLVRAL